MTTSRAEERERVATLAAAAKRRTRELFADGFSAGIVPGVYATGTESLVAPDRQPPSRGTQQLSERTIAEIDRRTL